MANMKEQAEITRPRILVVEDNLLNRLLVCEILKNAEIEYDIAENGSIAYELFLSHKYALILMDIQMPIMNGIECTKQIRRYEYVSNSDSKIPIVAVTAFASENDKQNCLDIGMNDFLAKPINNSNLIKVVSRFTKVGCLV
jgi:CheY-like chemotaxis protein